MLVASCGEGDGQNQTPGVALIRKAQREHVTSGDCGAVGGVFGDVFCDRDVVLRSPCFEV